MRKKAKGTSADVKQKEGATVLADLTAIVSKTPAFHRGASEAT